MSSRNASMGDAEKALLKKLRWMEHEALRRTDRFIRLFHRAKLEAVKQRWLDLALRNDQLAADARRQLREKGASGKNG